MRFSRPLALSLLLLFGASRAEALTLGVVAPKDGPYALLGQQIRAGAEAAAAATGAKLTLVDESCAAGSGGGIADALLAAKVEAAIGFLCSETLEGAAPKLGAAGLPALTLSVRWPTIMEDALKKGWPLYRLAPSNKAEGEKLADIILTQWAGSAFALIDDGTIHGRELVDGLRATLEPRGLKPVFTDTYRPNQENQIALVRRLQKTGATHVFIGGDRSDVAIIARDAASENIPLTLLAGDAMKAVDKPVPLANGVLAVITPDYADTPAAKAAAEAIRQKGVEPDGYALPAYAAVQFLSAASAQGQRLAETIPATSLDTVIGKIAFSRDHEWAENPYRLMEWRDGAFHALTSQP
ncbi:branched-chain amino acid ABC transporter substrate-binding protein [Rhizobium paknamense]|uniref:Branched-chain amino acid transport system substrate-binding protein n=1 Tax=Rhizobium paknamense TaxID=1206817 RepID=A0ABU0I6D4_9HYPH|nr:branched-chain amino acid ABC transporter substrate-binding protein [Rhizobium paknamense]MDQ0453782.1 branched-chain amino acid transport system substrate-binding protein [Rhizobium paknamense]